MMEEMNNSNGKDSQFLINQIILDYMKEQKRKRRWRLLTRFIFLIIIGFIVYQVYISGKEDLTGSASAHVGLIDLNGEIMDGKPASADNFLAGMVAAYKSSNLKALIIRINSPGGSAVQAEYMFNTIKYYRNKNPNIKVYAVCVDLCASAAYYLAAATDQIYASPSSMVGSIGVLYNGFGFVDLIQKLGVSRRLQTAGVNKGFLDPFSPINDQQKQDLQAMLDIIHQQFINRVKEGRGERLKIQEDTFSGLFWTGEQSLPRGLIDGFGSSRQVARDIIKIDHIVNYTHKQNLFDRVSKNIGTALADELPVSLGMKPGIK